MEKQIAVETLTSGVDDQNIVTESIIESPNNGLLATLPNDALITKQNLGEAIPEVKPKVDPVIVTAGTAMPVVVNFTYGRMPLVLIRIRGASNMFSDAGGGGKYELYYSDPVTCLSLIQVWIYGNDDGTGHLQEDIMYSIVGNV